VKYVEGKGEGRETMAQAHRSIKAFALWFVIHLGLFVSLFILFFNILPRYIGWLVYSSLWIAAFMGVFSCLLYTLVAKFLLKTT